MSDAPLFQNTDDQEAAYAPDELPRGTSGETRAAVDDANKGTGNTTDGTQSPVIPVVAGGVTGGSGGVGLSGGAGGGGNPAIGAAALDGDLGDRQNLRDRDA